MKISQKGINLIKEFEGCYLTAYKCPADVWTIGYGHTGNVDGVPIHAGMKITQAKAEELLVTTLDKKYEPAVRKFTTLNQNQYDALVSFCYNLGTGIFKGNLLNAINAENWNSVADQILLYNKARVNGVLTELAGLTRRRKAERKLFLEPVKEVYQVIKVKIEVNGVVKEVSAIEMDGNNFIKLRDLQDNKIIVDYNAEKKLPKVYCVH